MTDHNNRERMDRIAHALEGIALAIGVLAITAVVAVVAMLLLLGGCVLDPGVTPTPAPEGERVAVEIARMHLARAHGPLPPHTGEIVWTTDDCIWHDGECLTGAYHTHTEAIYLVDRGAIWRSELPHELVHYYLGGDGDHSRIEWWELVAPITDDMRAWEEGAGPCDGSETE
jgi:hypothetical protein